jgi:hypothetical protein
MSTCTDWKIHKYQNKREQDNGLTCEEEEEEEEEEEFCYQLNKLVLISVQLSFYVAQEKSNTRKYSWHPK